MTEKECKYGCGAVLAWDTKDSLFREKDGSAHTRERCAYLKSLLPKNQQSQTVHTNASVLQKERLVNFQTFTTLAELNAYLKANPKAVYVRRDLVEMEGHINPLFDYLVAERE